MQQVDLRLHRLQVPDGHVARRDLLDRPEVARLPVESTVNLARGATSQLLPKLVFGVEHALLRRLRTRAQVLEAGLAVLAVRAILCAGGGACSRQRVSRRGARAVQGLGPGGRNSSGVGPTRVKSGWMVRPGCQAHRRGRPQRRARASTAGRTDEKTPQPVAAYISPPVDEKWNLPLPKVES